MSKCTCNLVAYHQDKFENLLAHTLINNTETSNNCLVMSKVFVFISLNDVVTHVCRCQSAYSLAGTQRVSKFHESAENQVDVYMGLFRLPQHQADIVVTFNDPRTIR